MDIFSACADSLLKLPVGFLTISEALFAIGMRQMRHGYKWSIFTEVIQ